MPLTLEERERRAYIEGRTEDAELLSLAAEGDTATRNDLKKAQDEASRLDDECGRLASELDDTKAEVESLKDDLLAANSTVDELQRERTALEDTLALVG